MQTNKVLVRQMALEHQGGPLPYQSFCKMMEASPLLYKHDFRTYTDNIEERHLRNIAELKYLQQLLAEGKVTPDMLPTNAYNTFYPSYVLHHHYSLFLPLLRTLPKSPALEGLLKSAEQHKATGAVFRSTRRLHLQDSQTDEEPELEAGVIAMGPTTYFFSLLSSPYLSHAAFTVKTKAGRCLAVVRVREEGGLFAGGVEVRDLGEMISRDYVSVGYNFNGVAPLLVVPLSQELKGGFERVLTGVEVAEFGFSLRDLQKALWLTYQYTSMRKQFRTIEGSKQERSIITYQGVANRIINALAEFEAFSDLQVRALRRPSPLWAPLLQSAHHVILQHLIQLRECCGGFGYLQASGHPTGIEHLCQRAGQEPKEWPQVTTELAELAQLYRSDQGIGKHFVKRVTEVNYSFPHLFGLFLTIVRGMQKNPERLGAKGFRVELVRQSSIVAMYDRENNLRHEADNVHCQLLIFRVANYVSQHAHFIDWTLVDIPRSSFFEQLRVLKAGAFEGIVRQLPALSDALRLSFVRNAIVGRSNQQQFYEQVFRTSKQNRRNDKDYLDFIRTPVVELLAQTRGKL